MQVQAHARLQTSQNEAPTTFRHDSFSAPSHRGAPDVAPSLRQTPIHSNPFSANFGHPVFIAQPELDTSTNAINSTADYDAQRKAHAATGRSGVYQNSLPFGHGVALPSPATAMAIAIPLTQKAYRSNEYLEQSQKLELERTLRRHARSFVCLNLCFAFFAIAYIVRVVTFYRNALETSPEYQSPYIAGSEKIVRVSAIVFIVMYLLWLACTVLSVWAIASFRPAVLRVYVAFTLISLFLEISGSVAVFIGFKDWSTQNKTYHVIQFILTCVCQILFALQANQIYREMVQYRQMYMTKVI